MGAIPLFRLRRAGRLLLVKWGYHEGHEEREDGIRQQPTCCLDFGLRQITDEERWRGSVRSELVPPYGTSFFAVFEKVGDNDEAPEVRISQLRI